MARKRMLFAPSLHESTACLNHFLAPNLSNMKPHPPFMGTGGETFTASGLIGDFEVYERGDLDSAATLK